MDVPETAVRFCTISLNTILPNVIYLLCDWCNQPFSRDRHTVKSRIQQNRTTAYCNHSHASKGVQALVKIFYDEPINWSSFIDGTAPRPSRGVATHGLTYSKVICDGCNSLNPLTYADILKKMNNDDETYCCSYVCFGKFRRGKPAKTPRPKKPLAEIYTKFSQYQTKARKKNQIWNLSFEQFADLVTGQCRYCSNLGTGVDRVDNTRGYELDNVASCCKRCNYKKLDETEDEFLSHSLDIVLQSIPLLELQKILQSKIELSHSSTL